MNYALHCNGEFVKVIHEHELYELVNTLQQFNIKVTVDWDHQDKTIDLSFQTPAGENSYEFRG